MTAVLLHDGLLGLVDAIEFVAFVVNLRLGRVDVLHLHALGGGGQHTSAEGHHLAAERVDGEDDAAPESVAQAVVVRLVAEAGLDEEVFLVAFGQGLLGEGIVALGAVTQLELLDDVVAEATAAQVGHADVAPLVRVAQGVAEVVAGKLVDDEEAVAFGLCGLLFGGLFAFLDFDVVLLGQEAQGIGIGQLLVQHDEVHGVAPLAAGEALAEVLGGRDVERRRLVVVERAQAHIVHPALAQGDKVGHDVVDLRRVHDAVDGGVVNHLRLSLLKKFCRSQHG